MMNLTTIIEAVAFSALVCIAAWLCQRYFRGAPGGPALGTVMSREPSWFGRLIERFFVEKPPLIGNAICNGSGPSSWPLSRDPFPGIGHDVAKRAADRLGRRPN